MGKFDILDQLVDNGNGYLQTSDVLENGISKVTLAKYVKDRGLERVAHGIYMSEDTWLDDYYLLYLRNRRIIFSFESALYLHNMMDREPAITTVTVPKSYNSTHIENQGVRAVHSKPEWYAMGATKILTGYDNEVPVYDKDRTICDIVRNKKDIEMQTYQTAIKEYMNSSDKNLRNLMKYAKTLGIEDEIRTYTEVML